MNEEEKKIKITFEDKVFLNVQNDIPEKNKITADNINEIKEVVNNITENGDGSIAGDTYPIGAIASFAGPTVPSNWLLCNGQAVSRTDYSDLFAIIGTTYGVGDGSTTFNLPDLRGKTTVGLDSADSNLDALGKNYGEKEHTLTKAELPNIKLKILDGSYSNKDVTIAGYNTSNGSNWPAVNSLKATPNESQVLTTETLGEDQPHNNMQPSVATNFIIKAKQSAGVVATIVDSLESNSSVDALSAKQGKILDEKIRNVYPTELYSIDKTFKETKTGTIITLSDDITKYNRIVVYAMNNEGVMSSCEVYNPQLNDKFSIFVAGSGSRSGYYAFNGITRKFTISGNKGITYNEATTLTSHTASQANLEGFVLDSSNLMIYAVLGFNN